MKSATRTISLNMEQALILSHALKLYLNITEVAATDLYCRLAAQLMQICRECYLDDIEALANGKAI